MKISVDGLITTLQPDSLDWENPELLGHDGLGAPVKVPYWKCRLGFSRLTSVIHGIWYDADDGELHDFELPHPRTGELTSYNCYIESVVPRMNVVPDCDPALSGLDITLYRIRVV